MPLDATLTGSGWQVNPLVGTTSGAGGADTTHFGRPFTIGNIHGPGDVDSGIAAAMNSGNWWGPLHTGYAPGFYPVRLRFANVGPNDEPGPCTLRIGAALMNNSVRYQLPIFGRDTYDFSPGAIGDTDEKVLFFDGTGIMPITYLQTLNPSGAVASGLGFRSTYVIRTANGERFEYGTGIADGRVTGTPAQNADSYPGFGPTMLIGRAFAGRL
ncbi:MAG: hypothetical protein JWQ89_2528, partial [Devosia sp.]|uniref:hypothetical protein n=1 Tax=Devosia sp. TaxID=1871048 RepID=UPI00261F2E90